MEQQKNHAFALASGEGKLFWFLGTLMEVKVMGEETDGVFSLLEETDPPDYTTPLHIHHNEDEYFYVLEGVATFTVGEKTTSAKPGTFLFAPRNVAHMYRIDGSVPARILTMVTPAGLENFFIENSIPTTETGLPPSNIEPDMNKLLASAREYGVEILDDPSGFINCPSEER